MNSCTSTLNPYALSYIPLAKRDVKDQQDAVSDANPSAVDLKLKGQQVDANPGVPYENPHEMDCKIMDEESEMDLAYLQLMFPGVSEQSVADVYNVNGGNLDAAVDMLNYLESTENLPGALDTEDSQEPVLSGECSSVKGINVTGESSSSPSSDFAVAS